jgi:hypothetical protein
MNKIGKKRFLIDGPKIIHFEGGSIKHENKYDEFTAPSRMYDHVSRLKYYRKNKSNVFSIFILKIQIILIITFPILYRKNKNFINEILNI